VWHPAGALLHAHGTGDGVWGVPGPGVRQRGDAGEIGRLSNVPVARHYTAQDNGLIQLWEGRCG